MTDTIDLSKLKNSVWEWLNAVVAILILSAGFWMIWIIELTTGLGTLYPTESPRLMIVAIVSIEFGALWITGVAIIMAIKEV